MKKDDNGASPIFDTGSKIDEKWVLMERIGKGGMGEVYRAHQLNLRRDVALKLISEELLQDLEDNPHEVETAFSRFHREVQAMAQVRHPNVIQIYDYGSVQVDREGDRMPVEYIAMEYIPGNTLRYTMSEEGFDEEEELLTDWLRRCFLPVLDGAEAIHNHGIVHRDFKPENILMDGDTPKIADFGLARAFRLKAVSNSWDVKGTWPYMAPEQFADFRKAGREADIYALGKILYEAIHGKLDAKQLPFKSVGLDEPQTPLLKALDGTIRKATCEDKNERYQSIDEMRRAVRAALEATAVPLATNGTAGPAPAMVRRLWIGIAVTVLAVAAMAAYHLWNRFVAPLPPDSRPAVLSPSEPQVTEGQQSLPAELLAADGRTMKLVDATQQTAPFYTDPSLVTFHHYVEFLNAVADDLTVTDGVVQKGDDIWIYLGDGSAPNEQILFNRNKFQLRDARWAAEPVVRVTWLGARAYANYFGKRLPDLSQWQALINQYPPETHRDLPEMGESNDSPHAHMMPQSVPTDGTNRSAGASGAPFAASNRVNKEWLANKSPDRSNRWISHLARWPEEGKIEPPLQRQPWEGFSDAGFRTVMPTAVP